MSKEVRISLQPDYCCGGGPCGPMPGYFYKCPFCNEETSFKTKAFLELGDVLSCDVCFKNIKAKKKITPFVFDFTLED